MSVTLHNIAGIEPPVGFSHASAARGNTIVHVSGQVGTDENGTIADGLAAQIERALLNVALALAAAGATVEDLVDLTFYVVDWDPSLLEALMVGGLGARAHHPFPDAAATVIGVKSLFVPEHLVEIKAAAVVDG